MNQMNLLRGKFFLPFFLWLRVSIIFVFRCLSGIYFFYRRWNRRRDSDDCEQTSEGEQRRK